MPEDEVEIKDGVVNMKVTTKRAPGFYTRSAKSFFTGLTDKDGNKKEPVSMLNISGLGEAINTAVAAAMAVEGEGLGKIDKIETSYPGMLSGSMTRPCPRIMISLAK
mmetsp:Transcript_50426/g.141098  ORF Transcript_50426/g.141098 Transcript_50426/m.141098 type:complete len:107 (-) Transcript_50426:86-406(-)